MADTQGIIVKALSGFYYVDAQGEIVTCRARGKFRNEGITPLVGDRVKIIKTEGQSGRLEEILPRKNTFQRPAVSNIDTVVVIAAAVNPVTDPFLIDRVAAIAAHKGAGVIVCINKSDIDPGTKLRDIYVRAGIATVNTSALTGRGIPELLGLMGDKVCVFTGNSGVGKSSILNCIEPGFSIATGQVSDKLGRGRHTTRHTELYRLPGGALVADTPGFSSFDIEKMELMTPQELQYAFVEFRPYIGSCRYTGCAHIKERGCAVREAVLAGEIPESRHASYARLYGLIKSIPEWEQKKKDG